MDIAFSQTKVIIYVGNPNKGFRCKRSAIDASPLLSSLVVLDPSSGYYVMSPMLSLMKPDDFLPVGQYLERNEYDPNLLDEGTEWVRFERNFTEIARGQEVVRCGTIYSSAQQFGLPKLQDLAFRKLKALAKNEAYQPHAILCVIESTFASGKEDLRQYLVHYLAENYWDVVLAETGKAAKVMQGDKDLAKSVFGLLGGFVGFDLTDAQIKVEYHTKTEMPEETKTVPMSPEFFETTPRLTRGREANVDMGLGDTEQEAFQAVLQDSERTATEEEMTRIMEEESAYLKPY